MDTVVAFRGDFNITRFDLDLINTFDKFRDTSRKTREALKLFVHEHQITDRSARAFNQSVILLVPRRNLRRTQISILQHEWHSKHGPTDHRCKILQRVLVDDALFELQVVVEMTPRREFSQSAV